MKFKYKIDENNQLIISKGREYLRPKGKFVIDNNQLAYNVTEPADWRRKNDIPECIVLKGNWGIDKNHNLTFTLRRTEIQAGNERLLLKAELVESKANALIFSLSTKGKARTHTIRLLQLKGKWEADKHNRLKFLIKRLKASSDTLTFQGAWGVEQNTLTYAYKTTFLKTKKKHTRTLRFQGYWEITDRNRLTYILDRRNKSFFTFKTYLETPSLIGKRGVIKYRVGIGIKGSCLFKAKTITLYGVWKLHRKTGVSLQMDYGDGRIKEVRFGVFARIKEKTKITLDLRNRENKDLGIRVTFTRKFLKSNAEWFLRAVQEGKYPRIEGRITIPW